MQLRSRLGSTHRSTHHSQSRAPLQVRAMRAVIQRVKSASVEVSRQLDR